MPKIPKQLLEQIDPNAKPKKSKGKPKRKKAAAPKRAKIIPDTVGEAIDYAANYAQLDKPPQDTLGCVKWANNAVAMSMYHIVNSQAISEKQRWAEIRKSAGVLARLQPQSRIFEAEQIIEDDENALTDTGGPELKDASEQPTKSDRPTSTRGKRRQTSVYRPTS